MCDYSLTNVKSRPASVGDKLTVKNFGTGTRGFAASEDSSVAVCVLPGTELAFDASIETTHMSIQGDVGAYKLAPDNYADRTAIFRQINRDQPYMHHDALELPNGQTMLLNFLVEGQTATVLQLPVAPKTAEEAKEQERLAVAG